MSSTLWTRQGPAIITPRSPVVRPRWPFTVNRDSPQAEGLEAWYAMSPSGGEDAHDLIDGNTNTSTYASAFSPPNWIGTDFGPVVDMLGRNTEFFDATSNFTATDGVSKMTAVGWALQAASPNAYAQILHHFSATNTEWHLGAGGAARGDEDDMFCRVGTGQGWGTGDVIVTDTWNHYAMVFDGDLSGDSNRLKVYFNGVQQTLTFTGGVPATVPTIATPLSIGVEASVPARTWKGSIADARIYTKALSPQVIYQMWSPSARWQLYYEIGRVYYSFPLAAAPSTKVLTIHEIIFRP